MSFLVCTQCRNQHQQAQHRLTDAGRSAVCMFCEGPTDHSIRVDDIIPDIVPAVRTNVFQKPGTIWSRFLGLSKGSK